MTFRMCSKLGRFIEFRPSAGRCILVLLGLVSMVEALSTFTLIVRDLADLRWLDRVAGIWIAVVQTLAEGRGYPPLIGNDGTYGGVRYMPIYPLIINALSSLTGEYIVAGKLASLACLVLLYATVWAVSAKLSRSAAWAFVLSNLLFTTNLLLIVSKSTASGRATQRASSDPACFLGESIMAPHQRTCQGDRGAAEDPNGEGSAQCCATTWTALAPTPPTGAT